jgi:hypothetical protein
MSHTSDLVRDSKLNTTVRGDITRHFIPTSDRNDQHRLIYKEERWKRACFLGEGAFGHVWKETLERGESDAQERAVKMIRKRLGQPHTIDYNRELEAIAKFSGQEVSRSSLCHFALPDHSLTHSSMVRILCRASAGMRVWTLSI